MKSIYKNLILSGAALWMTSCNYTDLNPTDQVDDGAIFSSTSALEQVVNGAYAKISMAQLIRVSSILSDDVRKGGQNGGASDDTFQWTYTASTGDHNDLWSKEYAVINLVNRILAGAENLAAESDAEKVSKNNSIGTAKFLRAYNNLELLLFFSDIDKGDSYGIPYTFQPVVLETPGRHTVNECFEYLIRDLEEAMPLLQQATPDDPVYVSQTAVKALLARIYLYKKDYDKAYQYASQALKEKPLAGMEKYADIWSDTSNDDIIWKLKRLVGDETIGTIYWSADNSSAFEPSDALIDSYDAGDIRLRTFIGDGVDREGVQVKRVNKYKGTAANVGLADEKILRSSEMLLIMAEAKAQTDLQEASRLLNTLRSERIEGWENQTYTTKEAFTRELLLERRRELCFEGHRFFDMRRYAQPITKETIKKTLEVGNHRWLMPIPLAEMQGNPVIAQQQNPGY